jgi:hypothetical protein
VDVTRWTENYNLNSAWVTLYIQYVILITQWDILTYKRDLRSCPGIILTTGIYVSIYVNYISLFMSSQTYEYTYCCSYSIEATLLFGSHVTEAVLYCINGVQWTTMEIKLIHMFHWAGRPGFNSRHVKIVIFSTASRIWGPPSLLSDSYLERFPRR